jgi:FkbM family methyltransferase
MNWVARCRSGPFWTSMPADAGGLKFRCDLRDPLMREVCLTGRYEPQETLLLQHLLAPGMTFLDVGANWGYFTLLAAHLIGPTGRVISVEADPRACAALRANLAENRLAHARVVQAAASDGPGTLTLQAYGSDNDDDSNFGVLSAAPSPSAQRRFDVEALALDTLLDAEAVERVHVLKMDIEGAEARALHGFRRRLERQLVDRLVLELHPAFLENEKSSAASVIAMVNAAGYRAWLIDHSAGAHREAAAGRLAPSSLLSPLADNGRLDAWPHVLFVREGLDPLPVDGSVRD